MSRKTLYIIIFVLLVYSIINASIIEKQAEVIEEQQINVMEIMALCW